MPPVAPAAPYMGTPMGMPSTGMPSTGMPPATSASYGYAAPYPVTPTSQPYNGLAVAGMIVGIISMVFCWTTIFFGLWVGIVGAVLSGIGLRNSEKEGGKTMAIVGLVLSILAIVIGIIILIVGANAISQSTY